jgi:hypothetical protein
VLRGLLSRRAVAGRDAVELARQIVDAGCLVELAGGDPALLERLAAAGLASSCELTVDGDGPPLRLAADAGFSVAVLAPAVGPLDVPGVRIVVRADEPSAEERCRALAGRRVRLVAGRGRAGELAFVRCLNVLMAAEGHAAVAVSDPRLIAIAGERAAWNGRASDSWELVMPYGELVSEQRRLVAAGSVVRVSVGSRR